MPLVVQVRPTPKTDEETAQDEANRQNQATAEWWTRVLAVLTVALGLLQLGMIGMQARIASRQNKIMETQSTIMERQATTLNAQGLVSTTMLEVTKIIERAYVSMSHVPSGLNFSEDGTSIYSIVRITNTGHTPADVIAYDMWLVRQPLVNPNPSQPPIPINEPTSYIMPNDGFDVWSNFPATPAEIARIQQGSTPVFLVGWVVYRDRFGKRHRSGYGRRFVHQLPPGTANNLVFVVEAGYNYEEDLD